jgi:hypothetical protein
MRCCRQLRESHQEFNGKKIGGQKDKALLRSYLFALNFSAIGILAPAIL